MREHWIALTAVLVLGACRSAESPRGAAQAIAPVHAEVATAEAKALLDLAAKAARHKNPAIAHAALQAVGATRAPEGAAILKPYLRSKEPLALAAVQAAGKLRHDTLIPSLLDLAKTSSNLTAADQALFALGAYCDSALAVRKRVTERVLSLCQSISRNRKRWRRLRAPGLRALQRLMARRLNSLQQFSDWWKFRKGSKNPFSASAPSVSGR